ncbi:hypothetical protein Sta7437_4571 (plasmid) [Stanieria cyanosphaera PCC 7437]|uniref:DUF5895 domain-containing protein n=1 Tax=Stanieria cyanosphaera (strain ATCC 29371 / PCC 7437) TaxID=111780 RepID=K9XZK3_STAC7|nr:DUF5895 domain-containing protein [Stanieria cyanosphaera]AFZ38030.1 hypothetical protein Sta7437_4571 [Stanieria cyanosphaera PCC 7437]
MVESKTNKSKKAAIDSELEIDEELLDTQYNEARPPSLPYGIVINDRPAGILIPEDQLERANWYQKELDLTTVDLTEPVTGLLLDRVRLLVLATTPEYVRWKNDEDNLGEKAGTLVALYEEYRSKLNKKTQDVCSKHAMMFLDKNNQPLHEIPIVVTFKNVALWSFKSAKEEHYRKLEKVFAQYTNQPYSNKNDKWRSLGVLYTKFKAVKEGKGSNKSFCCKTDRIVEPTISNFSLLFLGKPERKQQVWQIHETITGFESSDKLLAAGDEDASVEILPPASNPKTRKIEQIEDEDDFELDEDDYLNDDFDD